MLYAIDWDLLFTFNTNVTKIHPNFNMDNSSFKFAATYILLCKYYITIYLFIFHFLSMDIGLVSIILLLQTILLKKYYYACLLVYVSLYTLTFPHTCLEDEFLGCRVYDNWVFKDNTILFFKTFVPIDPLTQLYSQCTVEWLTHILSNICYCQTSLSL